MLEWKRNKICDTPAQICWSLMPVFPKKAAVHSEVTVVHQPICSKAKQCFWMNLIVFLNATKSKMLSTTQSSLCARAKQKQLNIFLLVLLLLYLKGALLPTASIVRGLYYSHDHLQFWSQCSLKALEARLLIPWQASVFLDSVIGIGPWPLMAWLSDSWQWFSDGWSPITCPLTAAE